MISDLCPRCGDLGIVVPAGISVATGNEYAEFRHCAICRSGERHLSWKSEAQWYHHRAVAAASPFFVEHAVETAEPLSGVRLRAEHEERTLKAVNGLSGAARRHVVGTFGAPEWTADDLVTALSDESLDDLAEYVRNNFES